jgi:hypothetical protein
MHLGKFVHTETGKYLMSMLLGFGLASLFRTVCKDKNCLIFTAPHLNKIQNKIYKNDNKCYKYVSESAKCSSDKKIINFA